MEIIFQFGPFANLIHFLSLKHCPNRIMWITYYVTYATLFVGHFYPIECCGFLIKHIFKYYFGSAMSQVIIKTDIIWCICAKIARMKQSSWNGVETWSCTVSKPQIFFFYNHFAINLNHFSDNLIAWILDIYLQIRIKWGSFNDRRSAKKVPFCFN